MEGVVFSWLHLIFFVGSAAFGFLFHNFFKSPKEFQTELENNLKTTQDNFDKRSSSIEQLHTALALKFEGTYSRHDAALVNLTSAVEKLSAQFERFMEWRSGYRPDK